MPDFAQAATAELLWHEVGHSFVNPLTGDHAGLVARSDSLLAPIEGRMAAQHYRDWPTVLNEHLVRAVTVRLVGQMEGDTSAVDRLVAERARGFTYIDHVDRLLVEYEQSRARYETFGAFLPSLLGSFEDLVNAGPLPDSIFRTPFIGPIDAISLGASPVFVLPTAEADPAEQARLHRYVRDVLAQFQSDARIITDVEAQNMDLSESSIRAYGSIHGNLFLRALAPDLPLSFRSDGIGIGEDIYRGSDIRPITVWPHPVNAALGVVVDTATTTASVVGIHSVFAGGTDYVLARGTLILEAGNYRNKRGRWTRWASSA